MATMKRYGLRPVIQKDEAVSPIIATILLVAITVILASTLYLALGGFFNSKTTSTPTVSLSATSGTAAKSYVVTVGATSSNSISWSNVKVDVLSGTTVEATFTITAGGTIALTSGAAGTDGAYPAYLNGSVSVNYVTSGDQLTVTYTSTYAGPALTSVEFFYTGTGAGEMGSASL